MMRAVAVVCAMLLLPVVGEAQTPAESRFSWSGDARVGYFGSQRTDRDLSTSSAGDFRLRLRGRVGARLLEGLDALVGVAGRFSAEQDATSFYLRDHAPSSGGLELGQVTIDQAYLNYRPSASWNVRAGRMLTKFAVADLMGKTLDRKDSSNTGITWTDGVHLTYLGLGAWNAHLLLQHNSDRGPTNALRPPLDFDDAPVTVFAALESSTPVGALVQRGLDVTYIPGSITDDGGDGFSDDYVAVVARAMLGWPVGSGDTRIGVGGELGYAPNTPLRSTVGLGEPGSGDAGGLGFELVGTAFDVLPGHTLGVVYARTQGGWLVSPDFRINNQLLEGRYKWQFGGAHDFVARLRWRQDLDPVLGAANLREDVDFYLRFTTKF